MVDKFTIKNNLNKSNFLDGIIDPGIKSIDSIISKMYRKTHLECNNNFSLTDIKDVIRCSIIVDSYNQVIPLIRELRKSLPSLKGDVCENEMGYIGIHLSLIINGFNAEMQISTREAWYAKQAGEEIYTRWRDFSLSKGTSDLFCESNKETKVQMAKQLFSQYNLKSIESSYCKNMFSSLHKYTKLNKLKEPINAVLYLNSYNAKNNNDHLRKYKIKIKDVKNQSELLNSCQDYLTLAKSAKDYLIECANKALEIIRNNKDSKACILSEKEKNFIILKRKYFGLLTKEMKNKFNGNFEICKYISKLNKISNQLALDNVDFLDVSTIDNLNLNNNEDIIKLEKIIRRDIFSKNYFLSLINMNK
jgi:hypothetical protein